MFKKENNLLSSDTWYKRLNKITLKVRTQPHCKANFHKFCFANQIMFHKLCFGDFFCLLNFMKLGLLLLNFPWISTFVSKLIFVYKIRQVGWHEIILHVEGWFFLFTHQVLFFSKNNIQRDSTIIHKNGNFYSYCNKKAT